MGGIVKRIKINVWPNNFHVRLSALRVDLTLIPEETEISLRARISVKSNNISGADFREEVDSKIPYTSQ